MHYFGLDQNTPVSAADAKKHKDYSCPECGALIRARSGPHRQPHFFHVQTNPSCSQHKKSPEHLHAQLNLFHLLPKGESSMERPFPAIGRIADLCWESQRIVFEIQCSPIFQEEAECRNRDYRSQGFEIVWILHDKRFNRRKLSAAELFLRSSTCYFTNVSSTGAGIIYDQFDSCTKAIRRIKGPKLTVSLNQPRALIADEYPPLLKEKFHNWNLSFKGDCLDRWARDPDRYTSLQRIESLLQKMQINKPRLEVFKTLKRTYLTLLESLLKKLSANRK